MVTVELEMGRCHAPLMSEMDTSAMQRLAWFLQNWEKLRMFKLAFHKMLHMHKLGV